MTFDLSASPDFPAVIGLIKRDAGGRASAQLGEYRLSSHFQPIVSLSHQRVIGHEGLMRASRADGRGVSPTEVLMAAQRKGELVAVDRVARALHVLNRPAGEAQWLFLNVHPEVFIEPLTTSSFTADLLAHQQMTNVDVVIEVLEDAIRDEALFVERVHRLHQAGFLIALDDFGAGHSNFDRVWTIKPDIVKLDRSFALRSEQDAGARRLMPRIVNLLHEAGSLVLLEGIETAVQAQIALDSDIDFVQGYHFARPAAVPEAGEALEANIRALWHDFSAREASTDTAQRELIGPYQNALGYASVLIVGKHPFPDACKGFLDLPLANFCYLLDREGRQIGQNVWNSRGVPDAAQPSQRYRPLADASAARWSRRPYFRRAIRQLDRVQVTRPYLSASTAELCVTLSVGFRHEGEPYVLCGDIAWPG
jgi:EAL domain-containing protein (putative c-di-GMP-specific phosphodiesterase class I)